MSNKWIVAALALVTLIVITAASSSSSNYSYGDYLSEKNKINRLFKESPMLSVAVELVKFTLEIPGKITGAIAKFYVDAFKDNHTRYVFYEKQSSISAGNSFESYFLGKGLTFGAGYTGIVPEGSFRTIDGTYEFTSLREANTLSLLNSKGDWNVTYNPSAILYHSGKVIISILLVYLMYNTIRKSRIGNWVKGKIITPIHA